MAEPVYQVDPNGIPIKPGYRPPFNSETAKIHGAKGARATQLKWLSLHEQNRIAHEVLNQVRTMLEKRSKHGSKPHLAGKPKQVNRDCQVSPKAGQISPTVRPISKPSSSGESTTAPISPTVKPAPAPAKPAPVQDDDCLF